MLAYFLKFPYIIYDFALSSKYQKYNPYKVSPLMLFRKIVPKSPFVYSILFP